MAIIDINWKPSKRELRQFAGLWLVFFSLLGLWWWIDSGSTTAARWLWTAAAAIGLPGLLLPSVVRPIYLVWMALAFPIGWTVSHLLLGTIFYVVITPIGLVFRLAGKDPMKRRFEPDAPTYWEPHRTGDDPARYFKQY